MGSSDDCCIHLFNTEISLLSISTFVPFHVQFRSILLIEFPNSLLQQVFALFGLSGTPHGPESQGHDTKGTRHQESGIQGCGSSRFDGGIDLSNSAFVIGHAQGRNSLCTKMMHLAPIGMSTVKFEIQTTVHGSLRYNDNATSSGRLVGVVATIQSLGRRRLRRWWCSNGRRVVLWLIVIGWFNFSQSSHWRSHHSRR